MLDDFAKRIKEIRTSMNMTMGEFGDLGDVSATTQGAYEKENEEDRRYPDVKYLLNLKSKGIDIHYLLTGEKSPEDVVSAKAMEIVNAYENADDDHKAIFEAIAKASSHKPKSRVDKKKDDQDPPSGGSKSISGISAGGSVGDVMLDSTKSTTNNYVTTDFKKDYKLNFTWEETNEKISKHERQIKALANIIILFCLMSFLGEMLSYDFAPKDMAGQITEFFLVVLLPVTIAYGIYREASKKITQYFNEKRKRTKREIYLS